jgi:hypothetical protein
LVSNWSSAKKYIHTHINLTSKIYLRIKEKGSWKKLLNENL